MWKESASLILAARHGLKCNRTLSPITYDYKLLCLKRHQNSSFMPGNYVFPGGNTDSTDADLKWYELFSGFGFNNNSFASLLSRNKEQLQMFKNSQNELPEAISLRITAIRETFEECGILICKRFNNSAVQSELAQDISEGEVESWQDKVHNDAKEFYRMCEELQCYPDLWALHEWSNWLTPTSIGGKRYNTIFYLTCLPGVPCTRRNPSEMEELHWDTPRSFLSSSKIKLATPQLYEISRIANFECLDNLLDFTTERSKLGMQLMLPVQVKLIDRSIYVLPGDSMYPEQISLIENQVLDRSDMTMEECEAISSVKNRSTVRNLVVENLKSKDGHLAPISLDTVRVESTNKKSKY